MGNVSTIHKKQQIDPVHDVSTHPFPFIVLKAEVEMDIIGFEVQMVPMTLVGNLCS
jgi:hypothetical protein